MPYGLPWSEDLIRQLADKETRKEYVADRVRTRIALMIRALRENRGWSQAKLGEEAGKPQNVISRLESPDYGKPSLETLLEVAAAYDLPLFVDIPEWDDWFRWMGKTPSARTFSRRSFGVDWMIAEAQHAKASAQDRIVSLKVSAGSSNGTQIDNVSADGMGTTLNVRTVTSSPIRITANA